LNRLPTRGRLGYADVTLLFPLIAIMLSLLPVAASAASANNRPRHAGTAMATCGLSSAAEQQPAGLQAEAAVLRQALRNRRPWYIDPVPSYYGYDGYWHYFGRPGFNGGRFNGGGFGPCWTRTPIARSGIAAEQSC
jgi:hypothetical protein